MERDNWPSPRQGWITVWLLFACYTLSFADRQILVLLIAPIQQDLGISDVQFSLLSGLAFTFFYTLVGIPLAWLADRWSRRNLIAISVLVWTAMTAVCGFARGFAGLFLARIGVGIGEAGLSPAAYSILSDSFPPERRARAMSVYTLGSNSGLGLALIVGGGIAQWAMTAPPVELAGAVLKGWQLAFVIVSLPGPLLALLLLALVREPARREQVAANAAEMRLSGYFRAQWKLFLLLCLGFTLMTVAMSVYMTWAPALFGRVHGWNPVQIGTGFGLALLIGGTGGSIFGGWLADRQTRNGHRDSALRVSILGGALGLPLAIAAPFAPNGTVAMLFIVPMVFCLTMTYGLQAISFHAFTPNELRGRVLALFLLIGNMLAFTVAPTAVAAVSTYLFRDPADIGKAMALVSALCVPAGLILLQIARGLFRDVRSLTVVRIEA